MNALNPELELLDLTVGYRRDGDVVPVVRDLSLSIDPGQCYGLVGESGCGKSTTAMAIVRYLPANGLIVGGRVRVGVDDVTAMTGTELQLLRGRRVAVVYQDPRRALNPSMRVGAQVSEALEVSGRASGRAAMAGALDLLDRVALTPSGTIARRFPHQLSGGQQQRVVIAMAVAASPRLLILDEPTSSLDATVEAGVLTLLAELREENGCSILFISHDLALVARFCDRVGVLYAGRLMAEAPAGEVFVRPAHPYVLGLARSSLDTDGGGRPLTVRGIAGRVPPPERLPPGCAFAPRCSFARPECGDEPPMRHLSPATTTRCWFADEMADHPVRTASTPIVRANVIGPALAHTSHGLLLVVADLSKQFGSVLACDRVGLSVHAGETFGLVGESGSGKSTLGRCVVGLEAPDAGHITLRDRRVAALAGDRDRDVGRALQMVFQHPDSTLNPWRSVGSAIERARVRLGGVRTVDELLADVGLGPEVGGLRPGRLSGGQRQRVAIARALAGSPELVVCDEPVSALDVSVQASVLELLRDLQHRTDLALLFISHDLAVVRYLAHRIGVMLGGQLLEIGPTAAVLTGPHHPYTAALTSSATGRPPAAPLPQQPAQVSVGASMAGLCPYRARCPVRLDVCLDEPAPERHAGADHLIRCHHEIRDLAALLGGPGPKPETDLIQIV